MRYMLGTSCWTTLGLSLFSSGDPTQQQLQHMSSYPCQAAHADTQSRTYSAAQRGMVVIGCIQQILKSCRHVILAEGSVGVCPGVSFVVSCGLIASK